MAAANPPAAAPVTASVIATDTKGSGTGTANPQPSPSTSVSKRKRSRADPAPNANAMTDQATANPKRKRKPPKAARIAADNGGAGTGSESGSGKVESSKSSDDGSAPPLPALTPEQEAIIERRTNEIWSRMRILTAVPPKARIRCPRCGTASRYYCAICKVPLAPAPNAGVNATAAADATDTAARAGATAPTADAKDKGPTPPRVPPVPGIIALPVPAFRLPIDLDVIHHPKEKVQKSSAVQGHVLCPDQVTIYEYPAMPDYDPKTTCLLYPVNATNVCDAPVHQYKKAVFIDSTWSQSRGMISDRRLSSLPRLAIREYTTRFWRFQTGEPRTSLATLEAMYFFAREFDDAKRSQSQAQSLSLAPHHTSNTDSANSKSTNNCKTDSKATAGAGASAGASAGAAPKPASAASEYDGSFDNLLFYYALQYDQIQASYNADSTRKFTTKHYADYIKYQPTPTAAHAPQAPTEPGNTAAAPISSPPPHSGPGSGSSGAQK